MQSLLSRLTPSNCCYLYHLSNNVKPISGNAVFSEETAVNRKSNCGSKKTMRAFTSLLTAHVSSCRRLSCSPLFYGTKLNSPKFAKNSARTAATSASEKQQIFNQILQEQLRKMSCRYITVEKGAPESTNYSIYFKNAGGSAISPLHDIPLHVNEDKTIYNMVVEVPRWTNAKMEISLKNPLNPIKQDIKKGKLRYVANCFPHKGYIWNYGALPQTWENPDHIEPSTGCKGDNDPIDVLEIGYRVAKRGEVVQVKVLGTIALIDEGETDWKVIAIDVNDPLAEKMNDIGDVDKYFPGLLRATVEWFKIYKIPDGKPENQFAFNGDAKNSAFAVNVINETHKFWQGLISKSLDGGSISCVNTSVKNSPFLTPQEEADQIISEAAEGGTVEKNTDTVDKWHFIHLK